LPWVALSSGILIILLLVSAIIFKPSRNIENTVNRKIAFDKLKQIRIESTDNLNSKAFFDYFDNSLRCSVISTKWLFSEEGKVIYAKGVMAASTPLNSNIYSLVDSQNRGLIDAIECNVDSVQKRIMFVAASIRREGDHNDIYGHLVMPLKTSSNVLIGFVGVAYSLDDSKPHIQNYVISIALIICFLLYWLSLPLWVYFDCREKNNKYILWTIFVFLGNIPALIAYLISNRK
ncbi:MAG: hypothetical protein NTY95_19055, partial [Bacteroidia bacterium]|nr:hypothetical protein [Bacteroidia bacterium]